MNKWIERAIFINLIFIMVYVVSDYAMWMGIPSNMPEGNLTGTLENVRVVTNYNAFFKTIDLAGNYRLSTTFLSVTFTSQLPNLPLFIFLAMILTNILLLREATRKPVN